jgi:hypothetical protein
MKRPSWIYPEAFVWIIYGPDQQPTQFRVVKTPEDYAVLESGGKSLRLEYARIFPTPQLARLGKTAEVAVASVGVAVTRGKAVLTDLKETFGVRDEPDEDDEDEDDYDDSDDGGEDDDDSWDPEDDSLDGATRK